MKKAILIIALVTVATAGLWAQKVTEDREVKTLEVPTDENLKLGLLMGFPMGATMGYRMSNWFEVNLTAGTDFDSALISANTLFTLVNIPIGEAGVMPLSLGPQVNFLVGNDFFLDVVGNLRLEYTFQNIPLNLFAEYSLGGRFFDDRTWLAQGGGLGIRYVFR